MPNFGYTRDIPFASHNPSNDQGPMQTNTNSIESIMDVDHFGFGDNNGGAHDVIHFPVPKALNASPATGPNEWAVYNRVNASALPQVFVQKPNQIAGAADVQMTTNVNPINAAAGRSFLPGNLLMFWGSIAFVGIGTHNQPFGLPGSTVVYSLVVSTDTSTSAHSGSVTGSNSINVQATGTCTVYFIAICSA